MGEFWPGLQNQLHLLLFFQGKDWLFGCNSYLYHCILCCACELKQLSRMNQRLYCLPYIGIYRYIVYLISVYCLPYIGISVLPYIAIYRFWATYMGLIVIPTKTTGLSEGVYRVQIRFPR